MTSQLLTAPPAPRALRDLKSACAGPCCLMLLGLLLWGAGLPAHAQSLPFGNPAAEQQETTDTGATDTAAEAPAAIPVEEIPDRMAQARELARRATEAARPVPETQAAQQQIDALREQIEVLGETGAVDVLQTMDMRGLESAA